MRGFLVTHSNKSNSKSKCLPYEVSDIIIIFGESIRETIVFITGMMANS